MAKHHNRTDKHNTHQGAKRQGHRAVPKDAPSVQPPEALSPFETQIKMDAKRLMSSPEAGAPETSKPFSFSSRLTLDTHSKAGQSDVPGDYKGVDVAARRGELVVGVTGNLRTPQATTDGTMRDTATGYATVGMERENWGVYGHLGMQNGKVLDLAYRAVDGMHSLQGMGASRKSPASSDGGVLAGVSARYDRVVATIPAGTSAQFNAHASAFGTVGTDGLRAGVSAFAVLSGKNNDFRPDLPHMPATDKGTSLYAGVVAQGVADDLATNAVDTNPLQTSLVLGASLKLGEHLSVGVGAERKITDEIKSPKEKPVDTLSTQINLKF